MKTFTSIAILLSFATIVSASPKCERLAFYDMTNLQASFERDLVSNIWNTNLLGAASTVYFTSDGNVTVISPTWKKIETYTWSLCVENGRAMLSLKNDSERKDFVISPTCGGLSVSANGKSASMLVNEEVRVSDADVSFLEKQLTGIWNYRVDLTKKGYPAQFALFLRKDGTFILKIGPDKFHSVQQGMWQVTADGRYLVLNTKQYIHGEPQFVAEAINLKSVDFEDMVINAKNLPRALGAYQGKQPLYLSKARA